MGVESKTFIRGTEDVYCSFGDFAGFCFFGFKMGGFSELFFHSSKSYSYLCYRLRAESGFA